MEVRVIGLGVGNEERPPCGGPRGVATDPGGQLHAETRIWVFCVLPLRLEFLQWMVVNRNVKDGDVRMLEL